MKAILWSREAAWARNGKGEGTEKKQKEGAQIILSTNMLNRGVLAHHGELALGGS